MSTGRTAGWLPCRVSSVFGVWPTVYGDPSHICNCMQCSSWRSSRWWRVSKGLKCSYCKCGHAYFKNDWSLLGCAIHPVKKWSTSYILSTFWVLLSFHLRLRLTLFAVPQCTVAQNLNNYHQIGFFGMLMVPIVQIHSQTVSLSYWIGGQTVILTICSEMDGKNSKNTA